MDLRITQLKRVNPEKNNNNQFKDHTMNFHKKIASAAMIATFVTSGSALAATDGDQGTNSTGDTTITVTKQSEVKISGLNDIALTVQSDGSASGSTSACIYRNGTGSYRVTATGDGGAGAFSLSDGNSGVMPYAVTFDDGGGATTLTTNTVATGLNNANTLSATCNGATNATIAVAVSTADFSSAPAGDYTGVLTLLIAPE
jgi:hypothetical protein